MKKAQIKKMIIEGLVKEQKLFNKEIMAKAWAKFERESKNIQGSVEDRFNEIELDGCISSLMFFYEETELNPTAKDTANQISDREFKANVCFKSAR